MRPFFVGILTPQANCAPVSRRDSIPAVDVLVA
jgi:hypothetical protein